jgi:hypothetical protein
MKPLRSLLLCILAAGVPPCAPGSSIVRAPGSPVLKPLLLLLLALWNQGIPLISEDPTTIPSFDVGYSEDKFRDLPITFHLSLRLHRSPVL